METQIDYLSECKSSALYRCFLDHLPTKQLHNYIPLFVRHFEPIRLDVKRVLEIGVEAGTSLRMWADYFPNAEVVGFDIDPRCKIHETDRIKVTVGDQTKKKDLLEIPGYFDVIIDDGLHTQKSQIETFYILYREKMNRRGIYVVEDCEKRYQTIKYFKDLSNLINWWPETVHPSDWPKLNDLKPYLEEMGEQEAVENSDDAPPETERLSELQRFYVRHTIGVSIYRHIVFIDRGNNPEDGTAYFRLNEQELVNQIGRDRQEFLDLPSPEPEVGTGTGVSAVAVSGSHDAEFETRARDNASSTTDSGATDGDTERAKIGRSGFLERIGFSRRT